MVQQHTFPILKNSEILLCLNELGIPANDKDLTDPNPMRTQQMYGQFAELLLDKTAAYSHCPHLQDLAGMQELEFPELHEESTQAAAFFAGCRKLMLVAGIADFGLADLIKPEYKRLRRNISAVINLAKFREEKLPAYIDYTQETEALAAQKSRLEDENERLTADVRAAESKRNSELPELQRLEAENAERQVKVRELWNSHTAFHKESHALKARLHEVQDATREASYKLQDARTECEELKSQIVPDPVKLKGDLVHAWRGGRRREGRHQVARGQERCRRPARRVPRGGYARGGRSTAAAGRGGGRGGALEGCWAQAPRADRGRGAARERARRAGAPEQGCEHARVPPARAHGEARRAAPCQGGGRACRVRRR